jgi:2-polyprenyl-3-methyl-5-hydroxy-6-metoxy-1,4-benzoquinol methylase
MREIDHCEVCGNHQLTPVLDLGLHPLCDDLVPFTSDRKCTEYPIEILFCDNCKTAHQRYQVDKKLLFPHEYHYRAMRTNNVLDGMKDLVDSVEAIYGSVSGMGVCDIGCNDGSLLSVFRGRGATVFGVEPTDAADDAHRRHIDVYKKFFDQHSAMHLVGAYGRPDIITFTNVFAHIEDLDGLIEALKFLKLQSTVIVIENHYLGSILRKHQFDTFYHEHPRTYSLTSFLHIAERLGMHVGHVQFPQRYGGNVRVFLEPGDEGTTTHSVMEEHDFLFRMRNMSQDIETWKLNKRNRLMANYHYNGPIGAACFPGRAAILLRLLGLPEHYFTAVYESPGGHKVGHYVPGTRIPILVDKDYPKDLMQAPILNLAWHIAPEVDRHWRSLGYKGEFIQIVEESDFEPKTV